MGLKPPQNAMPKLSPSASESGEFTVEAPVPKPKPKPKPNGRVFSEQDEVALLKGMIDFESFKGSDPYSDMDHFHSFVSPTLSVDITKLQMTDKIRRLKKKFLHLAGLPPHSSNPHDTILFDLSLNIWAKSLPPNKRTKTAHFSDQLPTQLDKQLELRKLECQIRTFELVSETCQLIAQAYKCELVSETGKLIAQAYKSKDLEFQIRKLELVSETCQLSAQAIKDSV